MQEWLARGAARRAARRRCWSPTTSRRRSTSATACSCSRRARRARVGRARGARSPRAPDRARGGQPPAASSPARERALAGAARRERDEALLAAARWSSSALLALWELAARWDLLADALAIEPFLVPAPSDVADVALERPRAARRQRLGHGCRRSCSASRIAARRSASRFAVALHLSDALRRAFYPLLVASQTSR